MRRNILLIFICFAAMFCEYKSFAEKDPVAEMIHKAEKQGGTPEFIEEIDQVIRANPSNPQINALRLWRLRALEGLYPNEKELQNIVKEYEALLQEVGASTETGYEAQRDVGHLLYDCLQDKKAAFVHYKSMESNPILQGDDLQSEYRKVEVYTRLAQSAQSAGGMADEVEKYAKLAMAYPYLGMKNREMYRKFYQLYEDAAKSFLIEFRDDAKQLRSIEIYPSHTALYKMHEESLKRLLVPENVTENIISDIDHSLALKKKKLAQVDKTTTSSDKEKTSPMTPKGTTAPTTTTNQPISLNDIGMWIFVAVIVVLIIFLLILYVRKRK